MGSPCVNIEQSFRSYVTSKEYYESKLPFEGVRYIVEMGNRAYPFADSFHIACCFFASLNLSLHSLWFLSHKLMKNEYRVFLTSNRAISNLQLAYKPIICVLYQLTRNCFGGLFGHLIIYREGVDLSSTRRTRGLRAVIIIELSESCSNFYSHEGSVSHSGGHSSELL